MSGRISLTQAQADSIFEVQLATAIEEAYQTFPLIAAMPPNAVKVVVDLIFNLGNNGFLEFHHFIADMKSGNYKSDEGDLRASLWAQQVPNRAARSIALLEAA